MVKNIPLLVRIIREIGSLSKVYSSKKMCSEISNLSPHWRAKVPTLAWNTRSWRALLPSYLGNEGTVSVQGIRFNEGNYVMGEALTW